MAHRTRDEEVMDVAVELHGRMMRDAERETGDHALTVAAAEVGVPPALVEEAVRIVDERRRVGAARALQKRRVLGGALSGLLALSGLTYAVWPAPVPIVVEGFEDASSRWSLDKNSESAASLRASSGGTLSIVVERFGAQADGKYHVNADRRLELPPLDRHRQVTVRARGVGLEVVRLFLEGDGVRWRSPPITLTPDWRAHTLPLSSFERQVREPSGHRVVDRGDVGDVRAWSLKVGHFMNAADAAGEVEIDELRFE